MSAAQRAVDNLERAVRASTTPGMRRRLNTARLIGRRPTSRLRKPPGLLIIGAMRCGTSSLYKYLGAHPCVAPSVRKETEYFTRFHSRGENWYLAHFALRARDAATRRYLGGPLLTFEATPYYLFHPHAPRRAAELVPDAKLIVLLREPGQRAFSHHAHMRRLGLEQLEFEAAIEQEASRLEVETQRLLADPRYDSMPHRRYSYLARGRYADQLERWLQSFDREQFLILDSSKLYSDPSATYAEILNFAGLPPFQPRLFRNYSYEDTVRPPCVGPTPAMRRELDDYFASQNERLARVLGTGLAW